jgi:hypothetical protein
LQDNQNPRWNGLAITQLLSQVKSELAGGLREPKGSSLAETTEGGMLKQ